MIQYDKLNISNKNLYFLCSYDYYSIKFSIEKLTENLSMKDLNCYEININEISEFKDIKVIFETCPVMDNFKVLILSNFNFKSSLCKEIIKYIKQNLTPTFLKIIIPYFISKELNFKKNPDIQSIDRFENSVVVYPNNKFFIDRMLKDTKLHSIREILYQNENLDIVKNDISKLKLMDWKLDDIRNIITKPFDFNIWDLINQVSNRHLSKALEILKILREKNTSDVLIALALGKKFKDLYLIKQYYSNGYKDSEIQNQLKFHPYVIKISMEIIKNFSIEKLEDAYIDFNKKENFFNNNNLELYIIKLLN